VNAPAQAGAGGADGVAEPARPAQDAVMRVLGVSKRFGAVTALEDVSIDLHAGETVGLVGDNGAGKSTLLKIMSGVHPPDEGRLEVDGQAVSFASPAAARDAGIEAVYQDLALVEDMTVAENLFLGREMRLPGLAGRLGLINRKTMHARAAEAIDKLRIKIPGIGDTMVRRMSGGQRQGVAIARTIMWGRKVLLLDEPTAALGVEQQDEVERLIHGLQQHSLPMMIIAHNMPLVFRLTQRIVVLRHGRVVADMPTAETTPEAVVAHITGAARIREHLPDG
jgi:simple sugar transport system ATP-binding protein